MVLRRLLCSPATRTRRQSAIRFTGGLKDFLADRIEGQETVTKEFFTGRSNKREGHGAVEWAIAWVAGEDGFLNSLLQHRADARRRHP